jgi:hypothetical protein
MRTDLADCGVYIFTHQCYRLLLHLISVKEYNWCSLSEDVIPFLARNQYKQQIQKMFEEAQVDKKKKSKTEQEFASKIEDLMKPGKSINRDFVKVMAHIDALNSKNLYRRIKDKNQFHISPRYN